MKNKIAGLIVLTALLFIAMAVYQQWFGLLCMGGAFVSALMAYRVEGE